MALYRHSSPRRIRHRNQRQHDVRASRRGSRPRLRDALSTLLLLAATTAGPTAQALQAGPPPARFKVPRRPTHIHVHTFDPFGGASLYPGDEVRVDINDPLASAPAPVPAAGSNHSNGVAALPSGTRYYGARNGAAAVSNGVTAMASNGVSEVLVSHNGASGPARNGAAQVNNGVTASGLGPSKHSAAASQSNGRVVPRSNGVNRAVHNSNGATAAMPSHGATAVQAFAHNGFTSNATSNGVANPTTSLRNGIIHNGSTGSQVTKDSGAVRNGIIHNGSTASQVTKDAGAGVLHNGAALSNGAMQSNGAVVHNGIARSSGPLEALRNGVARSNGAIAPVTPEDTVAPGSDDLRPAVAAPSTDDLHNKIDLLQREIRSRNVIVQETVRQLSNASLSVVTRLQSSSTNVKRALRDLQHQAETAENGARLKEDALRRARRQFLELEEATALKLRHLADQLQTHKFQSHEAQIAVRRRADEEQSKLKERIHSLEKQLKRQPNSTVFDEHTNKEIQERRSAINKKLASVKEVLADRIQNLEIRLAQLKAARVEEQRRIEDKSKQEIHQLRGKLEKVIQEAEQRQESLRNSLMVKELQQRKAIQQLRQQSDLKEKSINEKVKYFANELQRVILESHQKLMVEREINEIERKALLEKMENIEREGRRESAKASDFKSQAKEVIVNSEQPEPVSLVNWKSRLNELEERRGKDTEDMTVRKADLELGMKSKDTAMIELETLYKKKLLALNSTVLSVQTLLNRTKVNAEAAVMTERRLAAQQVDSVRRQLEKKEIELSQEKGLRQQLDTLAQEEKAQRLRLEQELSVAQQTLAMETAHWKEQRERVLSEKESEIEKLIELHKNELNNQKALHAENITATEEALKRIIKELRESNALKEKELQDQIDALNRTAEDLRMSNEKHQAHQKDHAADVAEWISKYNALEKLQLSNKEQIEAEYANRESETQKRVESTIELLRVKEDEFSRCLKSMDSDYRQKLEDIHQQYLDRERDLVERIEHSKTDMQEAAIQAKNSFAAERKEWEAQLSGLQSTIQELHADLAEKTEALHVAKLYESNQKHSLQILEDELSALKDAHSKTIANWTERCATLTQQMQHLVDNHKQELHMKENQMKAKTDELNAKMDKMRQDMELTAKARNAFYEQKLDHLQKTLDNSERQFQSKVEELLKLKLESTQQVNNLQSQIQANEEQLKTLLENEKVYRSESDRLRHDKTNLQDKLEALKKEHEAEVTDWSSRYSVLEGSIIVLQQANVDALLQKDAEWKDRMDLAVTTLTEEKSFLENSVRYREKLLNQKVNAMKESSLLREEELKERLRKVMDEFQSYKFSSHKALMEAQQQIEASMTERQNHDGEKISPATLERVRFDLSKLIVKKEVEMMSRSAELVNIRTGRDKPRQRKRFLERPRPDKSQLSPKAKTISLRERLRNIFSGSTESDISVRTLSKETELVQLRR